ncbi:MAG: hypothetical protein KKB37_10305, partial [Alphaproteobacteria bacterium]|nr:hypothetical protein [Alphaproteobacteria bacterium]
AYLYRTIYDKSCQCRPAPWSEEAKQRHALYREEGWQKKLERIARTEAEQAARRAKLDSPRRLVVATEENNEQEADADERFDPVRAERSSRRRSLPGRMSLGRDAPARPQARSSKRGVASWRQQVFSSGN